MATYNGGRFIEAQIESIRTQNYPHWDLYIRDDGSQDNTVVKIRQIEGVDSRVKLLQDELGRLGVSGNFSVLMSFALEVGAEYTFFSDQDDVWQADKLETMIGAMLKLEHNFAATVPLLVHSDLVVVNEQMLPIAESFIRLSGLSHEIVSLGNLLCKNQITGCACVINRALLEFATPIPPTVPVHDWWLALLAASAGKILYISRGLVKYRQHNYNVVGAIPHYQRLIRVWVSPDWWSNKAAAVRRGIEQAKALDTRINSRGVKVSAKTKGQITSYAELLSHNFLSRLVRLRQQEIGMISIIERVAFNAIILSMKK
jgi:glycosyltransferase involved in cell wall biosynthesis